MTTPDDALWTSYKTKDGAVHNATIMVVQNVSWEIEVNGIIYTGTYC